MSLVRIDGSLGEGGGQILRSSLALSAITSTPFRIENIRANRQRPGLLRQHLTAVHAAAEVCGASVDGGVLASSRLEFRPSRIRAGAYRFSIGSAGSASLVCQTVLPLLLRADAPSEVVFEGGTHNSNAPPYDFLERVFFRALRAMGGRVESKLIRHGFYPAGGGAFRVRVEPSTLGDFQLLTRNPAPRMHGHVTTARLPRRITDREVAVLQRELGLDEAAIEVAEVESLGPGNVVAVELDGVVPERVTAFGEKRRAAEAVALEAVDRTRAFLASGAPVGEHLADQLLLPLAIGRGGAFRASTLSKHTRTNIDVIRRFLAVDIAVEHESSSVVVRVTP